MARIWNHSTKLMINKHKQTSFDYAQDKNTPLKRKVFVAMSGGVDSSVAAALLKKQSYDVTGVFMKPWSPIPQGRTLKGSQGSTFNYCLWRQDREDALRAAAVLGIPFLTWDFSREYKKAVGDYMIREYRAGRTPNPDVMCNKEIKFGFFLKKALKEGADFVATGHYVRLEEVYGLQFTSSRNKELKTVNYKLKTALDLNKDQSYFLWTLTQDQLKYCLFPIGGYLKPEIRKMAKKFGLPNYSKKDSQGVCFIGPLDMKNFLEKYIRNKKGPIIERSGKKIGEHDGIYFYTIGQRHGLNIGNGQGPYYVIGKDIKKNILYVGKEIDLEIKNLTLSNINWINRPSKFPAKIDVKIRYRSYSVPAIIDRNHSNYKLQTTNYELSFHAITPGQSAVFYKGEEMLGGGIIT